MINKNELIRKIEDLQYTAKLKVQASIGLNVGLNLGVLFGSLIGGVALFPVSIFGVGIIIGSSINYFRVSSKVKKLFENIVDLEKYKDQIEFLNKLSKLIDEHYKEAFKGYNFNKEEQICKQIKLNSPQQMDSKLIGDLKLQTQKIFQTQEDNHYNILVLGRTGVGKSTLINVVLDLKGEKAAKENAIKPETGVDNNEIIFNDLEKTKKKFIPIEYGSEKSSLVLLDSRGIETSKRYNIDIAAEDIKQFINERNSFDADPDKFIHCIWYLVSGKRFEDDEGNYVKSLKSLYTNFGLPIIFVYTQATNEEDGDLFKERIGEFLGENINFIQIIARDIFIKTKRKTIKLEAFGVFDEDGLIKKTFDLSRNAIKSSYFNYMKNLLKNIFINNIKMQSYLKTSLLICTKIKSVIHEKNKSLEEIRNSFENEFLDIINNFLIVEEIPDNTIKNKNLIKEYFNCFPNLNDPNLLGLIDKIRENEIDKLIVNYMDMNLECEKIGIKNKQGKKEIENMLEKDIIDPIKNRIPYIALSFILFKYLVLLGDYLFKKLSEDFEESYKRIEDQAFEELKILINKVYDNIMKKCLIDKEKK